MLEKYLVLNAGSSSLKFSVYNPVDETVIGSGNIEKIGEDISIATFKINDEKITFEEKLNNHSEAVNLLLEKLVQLGYVNDLKEVKAVGHRILHGGEIYNDSVLIDDEVIENIKGLINLGPLHLPSEIDCINNITDVLPEANQVAVFDTSFHQTIPDYNYRYAVPKEWYEENGVRKYGFHGTSHKFINQEMQTYSDKPLNLIICHLGNGSSISAVKEGKCIDTTMGLTPLDGLIMGTRSGAIDPSIIEYICKERSLTVEQVTKILNSKSGLLGLCGKNDLRDIEVLYNDGSEDAILAYNMLVKSITNNIISYYLELEGNVDAIVLTAGIGENSAYVRKGIVNRLSKILSVKLNEQKNEAIAGFKEEHSGTITTEDSQLPIIVMPTNEELMILKDTKRIVQEKESNISKKLA